MMNTTNFVDSTKLIWCTGGCSAFVFPGYFEIHDLIMGFISHAFTTLFCAFFLAHKKPFLENSEVFLHDHHDSLQTLFKTLLGKIGERTPGKSSTLVNSRMLTWFSRCTQTNWTPGRGYRERSLWFKLTSDPIPPFHLWWDTVLV